MKVQRLLYLADVFWIINEIKKKLNGILLPVLCTSNWWQTASLSGGWHLWWNIRISTLFITIDVNWRHSIVNRFDYTDIHIIKESSRSESSNDSVNEGRNIKIDGFSVSRVELQPFGAHDLYNSEFKKLKSWRKL